MSTTLPSSTLFDYNQIAVEIGLPFKLSEQGVLATDKLLRGAHTVLREAVPQGFNYQFTGQQWDPYHQQSEGIRDVFFAALGKLLTIPTLDNDLIESAKRAPRPGEVSGIRPDITSRVTLEEDDLKAIPIIIAAKPEVETLLDIITPPFEIEALHRRRSYADANQPYIAHISEIECAADAILKNLPALRLFKVKKAHHTDAPPAGN